MCIDQDLFGEVVITFDDLELWLDLIPRHLSDKPRSRITMLHTKSDAPS